MTEEQTLSDRAVSVLDGFLQSAALDAHAAVIPATEEGTVTVGITGPDAGYLVGPRGQYLDALQHMFLLMMRHTRDQQPRLTLDADGYRARRAQTLAKFAQELADQVIATGQEAVTDPLNPMERRIVHTALLSHPDVTTYSEGMEPDRYVVVSPRFGEAGNLKD